MPREPEPCCIHDYKKAEARLPCTGRFQPECEQAGETGDILKGKIEIITNHLKTRKPLRLVSNLNETACFVLFFFFDVVL